MATMMMVKGFPTVLSFHRRIHLKGGLRGLTDAAGVPESTSKKRDDGGSGRYKGRGGL